MAEDYFSKSPPEILLKILVQVPASDYLALARTSKLLRNLMKVNSATICNNRIKEIHPKAAEILHSTLIDKWLVPTHPGIGCAEINLIKGMVMSCLPCSEALDALFENGGIHGPRENPPVKYALLPIHDHGIPEDISQRMFSFGGPLFLEFLETEGEKLVTVWERDQEELAAWEKEADGGCKVMKDYVADLPHEIGVVWSWLVENTYCAFMEVNGYWQLGYDMVSMLLKAKAAAEM